MQRHLESAAARIKSEDKRIQLAQEVNHFVQGIQKKNTNAPVVVLGDMNDFEFSKPLKTLEGTILKDMLNTVPKRIVTRTFTKEMHKC